MEFLLAASSVLPALHSLALSLLESKYELLLGVEKDLKKLSSSLITIQKVVHDIEEKQPYESDIEVWLARIISAACDAEKILKSLETEARLWQQKQQTSNAPVSKFQTEYELQGASELKNVLARLYAADFESWRRKDHWYKFVEWAKRAGGTEDFCTAHGRCCSHEGCSDVVMGKTGFCFYHFVENCTYEGCTKDPEGLSGLCISHGGGRRCQYPECTKRARRSTMLCEAHIVDMVSPSFGGKKSASGLTDYSGDKRCVKPECSKSACGRSDYCIRHGGGKRCKYETCGKSSQGSTDFCRSHCGGQWCLFREGDGECGWFSKSKTGLCAFHGAMVHDGVDEDTKSEVVGVEDMNVDFGAKHFCLSVGGEAELSSLTSCVPDGRLHCLAPEGRVQEDSHGSGVDWSKIMNSTDSQIVPFTQGPSSSSSSSPPRSWFYHIVGSDALKDWGQSFMPSFSLDEMPGYLCSNEAKRKIMLPNSFSKTSPRELQLRASPNKLHNLMSSFVRGNKRKDLWHFFVSSYPMDQMTDLINCNELQKRAFINYRIRAYEAALHKNDNQVIWQDNFFLNSCQQLELETTAYLNAFLSEMRPYLPQGWTLENNQLELCAPSRQASSSNVVPDWAIESAIVQASHFFTNGLGRLLAISGRGAERVAEQLAHEPLLNKSFDLVLYVSLSQYRNNEEIETSINEFFGASMSGGKTLQSLNFLLILDCLDESFFDLFQLNIPMDHGCIVFTTQLQDIYHKVPVDMEIKMEYHLLPWELFCTQSRPRGYADSPSGLGNPLRKQKKAKKIRKKNNLYYDVFSRFSFISQKKKIRHKATQKKKKVWAGPVCTNVNQFASVSCPYNDVAIRLVKECHCNLLAIILLARALKFAEVDVWEQAHDELKSRHSSITKDAPTEVLIRVIMFIWKQKNLTTRRCIQHYIDYGDGGKTNADFMILCWLLGCLVNTAKEGEEVVEDLLDSYLIELTRQGSLQMQEKIREVLTIWILPHCGTERMGTMIIRRDAKLINLENTDLKIAPTFFGHMPMLKVLNLSHTSIMTLPSSISKLVSLEKLILRCCELLIELPPEIEKLRLLKVLDLYGTEIMYIPNEIENLTGLEELRLSIYGHGERFRRGKGIRTIYPRGAFSKLVNLEELSIDVNPEEKQWFHEVGYIVSDLMQIRLRSLKLYLPKVELLGVLIITPNFKLIVGQYEQRLISRIPHEVEEKFWSKDKILKYINGDGISAYLVCALKWTDALFLDRHWTIKKLSEVGSKNLATLELALFVECNELETILDEGEVHQEDYKLDLHFNERLGSLEYLGLYYLRNLTSICRGRVGMGTLSKLKNLNLRTCTGLSQVFTFELLKNLENLEELVLEDCPKIKSLVTGNSPSTELGQLLPKLKKMSLIGLPELVSITNGICIAPELEQLVVFYCPKLELISKKELGCKKLKVLKGESEWWDSLGWDEWDIHDQENLDEIFVPIRRDGNLNDQFT